MASMTNASALTMLDTAVDAVDTGAVQPNPVVRCYDGTVPTNVDTSLSGNTVLAELAMTNPAFQAATDAAPGATVSANAISDDSAADATGTVSFARLLDRQAVEVAQIQVTAGEGGEELVFNTASFTVGVVVQVSSLILTLAEV